ncbi:MAG: hypothetical protein SF052_26450 [Bacteroidia bacterium]|nr:hypothetical protein [Bacteroidia bacterium]
MSFLQSIILLQAEKTWLLMSDKVYSVLTVILLIFGALIGYLVLTNRKIRNLEKKLKE